MTTTYDPELYRLSASNILRECNALAQGHFVYTSGRHGDWYINKDAVYPHPDKLDPLTAMLAAAIESLRLNVQTIVSPAVGAITLGALVAHQLYQRGRQINAVYAEKDGDEFTLKRGYASFVRNGARCVVVEDNLTTGGSVKKVIKTVRDNGGEVVAVAALCNRGGVTTEGLEVPHLISLLDIYLRDWTEQDCPLCREGVPVSVSLGKGRDFLARQGASRTSA
ncbi:orotate phosphoribosyltransferase [Candidatus Peregrinibacteria bacterium]|nr:orotate phosphoribosyltransferase [Candidatus Peregrinibacteria bacterium]